MYMYTHSNCADAIIFTLCTSVSSSCLPSFQSSISTLYTLVHFVIKTLFINIEQLPIVRFYPSFIDELVRLKVFKARK